MPELINIPRKPVVEDAASYAALSLQLHLFSQQTLLDLHKFIHR